MINYFKTFVLMLALTMLLMLVGSAVGGPRGMIFALVMSFVMNFGMYWFSSRIVLMMYRAKEISMADAPELYSIVQTLAMKANIPMPKVYILPMETPNAFATGRNPNNAVVAVSPSLLRMLTSEEIEAVLAHELSHIKNRDILVATIAAGVAGAISMIAHMIQWGLIFGGYGGSRDDDREGGGGIVGLLFMIIIVPLVATLIQLAISRSREYIADEGSADITKRPSALASALRKIHEAAHAHPMEAKAPATAHLFIVNPFKEGWVMNLLSTHPTLERRVLNLEKISKEKMLL